METINSLPLLQEPATCPYPEPDQSSPYTPSHFLNILLNVILSSTPGSSKWSFPSGFHTKTLYTSLLSPIRATTTHALYKYNVHCFPTVTKVMRTRLCVTVYIWCLSCSTSLIWACDLLAVGLKTSHWAEFSVIENMGREEGLVPVESVFFLFLLRSRNFHESFS